MDSKKLLTFIPPDARNIVEISSCVSNLEEQYRKINAKCKYKSIEFNKQTEDFITFRLSSVENNIDCLIYNNVLEHIDNVLGVLKQQVAKLDSGSQVIACIANIKLSPSNMNLLQRERQCSRDGGRGYNELLFSPLDRICDVFTQAGLTVVEIRTDNRFRISEDCCKYQDSFRVFTNELSLNIDEFNEQIEVNQYFIRALKGADPTQRLFIHSLLGEAKVCARVRILEPHSFLATIPGVRVKSEIGMAQLSESFLEKKVFIWQRVFVDNIVKQKELLRRGYLILAEIDDDPLRWASQHQANDFLTFRSCHGIQVSTEPLADFLRHYNPNVVVFPNQLAYLPEVRVYDEAGPITIFFGALNREADWLPIISQLNLVLNRYKQKVKVKVIHDRKFFDALAIENKVFSPFCSYSQYIKILRSADIAILPLQPGRFNEMKSDLKFLECAANGVASLASPTVYRESIIDGETGLLYFSPTDFAKKLILLINDTAFRWYISHNAYKWVAQERMLSNHYRKRYDWYLHMFDKLEDLNKEVKIRMPGQFT